MFAMDFLSFVLDFLFFFSDVHFEPIEISVAKSCLL